MQGEESFWVNGFNVAAELKRDHPEDYQILTRVPWPHSSCNVGNAYRTVFPLFQCDAAGQIDAIRDMQVEHKLRLGDVAFVDNRRCLHGRRTINASTGHRHFRTAYSERDEVLSTLRTLERELAHSTV
ncbi:MAG: TauD/TfdA family dioxygenase [Sulfitobacter sp.]